MQFTVNQINPLGDFDEKYGQRYWGHVHESDYEVSFNLMNPVNVEKGDKLSFEEKLIKESKKGREYLFLRKVKVNSGSGDDARQSPSTPTIKEEVGKSHAPAADSKYLKDVSDMKYRVWVKLLDKLDVSEAREIHKQKYAGEAADFWEAVDYHTDELLRGIENTRSGEPKAPEKASTELSGRDKARATADRIGGRNVTKEFDDSDLPDFQEENE